MKKSVIISGLLFLSISSLNSGMQKPTNHATGNQPQACIASAATTTLNPTYQAPKEEKIRSENNKQREEEEDRRKALATNIDNYLSRSEKLDIFYSDRSETLESVSRNFYRKKPSWFAQITAFFSGKK
jgi:hypothetical protein